MANLVDIWIQVNNDFDIWDCEGKAIAVGMVCQKVMWQYHGV